MVFPRTLLELRRSKGFVLALSIFMIFITIAIIVDYLPIDPYATHERLQPPSLQHIFGTDRIGRDVFSRILYATKISIFAALTTSFLALVLGIVLGAIAGYYGGLLDSFVSRTTDFWVSVPRMMLLILLVAILGKSIFVIILVVSLTLWPSNAKIMRAQVLSLKTQTFVEAAKSIGGGSLHILFRHIFPLAVPPVLANASFQVGQALLLEAGLSFLGLGDPRQISWGTILYDGRPLIDQAWWIAFFAGVPLTIVSYTFIYLNRKLLSVTEQEID